jgi:hypothetical protein
LNGIGNIGFFFGLKLVWGLKFENLKLFFFWDNNNKFQKRRNKGRQNQQRGDQDRKETKKVMV